MVLERLKAKINLETPQVDIREAFNLWDILNSKYREVERLLIYHYFVHDKDLKFVIKHFIKEYEGNISKLKKEISKYQIIAPKPNREIGPTPCRVELFTDEYIAGEVLIYLQEHIENLVRYLKTSMTNDSLHSLISKITKKTIISETMIMDYMNMKGWVNQCPRYHNKAENVKEKLSVAEAFHLWDHLCYRYDNIQQTRFYLAFVHDLDFVAVMKSGLSTLMSQAKILEKELVRFGIVTPTKPSDVTFKTDRIDILEDRHIYRTILLGLQGALSMHVIPLKQCSFNAILRDIYKKLLLEEIDIFSNYIKFGRLKGWLEPAPAYVN